MHDQNEAWEYANSKCIYFMILRETEFLFLISFK